ncbi:b(0,+)-type amino acid transporter 1-like isoform X2 [Pomacea canaliculata]|uniref:b(0,+)-type amino acid transporter 1-like isoform X2 n=1 Tax=Pomacea canaliculata TaxID=400727 RepID=UPI000D7341AD|nr:b(0,+)-type amino acid transporter 1-like isoform X2 [Pomacea canaliculata]
MALRRLDQRRLTLGHQEPPRYWRGPSAPGKQPTVHFACQSGMEQTEARNRRWRLPDVLSECPKPSLGDCFCKQEAPKVEPASKTQVGKEIGLIYGGSLIVNTLIGPGIFTSPKGVISGAGSVGLSLVIWAACGVFSTMAGLCFAELRESVKREGVEYAYITEAFGPLAGFVYCWMRIAAAEPVGTAVFALALADYSVAGIYGNCLSPTVVVKTIAALAVVTLALLNVFSQKLADRVQVLASVGKATALTVIILFGIKNIAEGRTKQLETGFEGTVDHPTDITFAIYNALWAYGGWANVNHVTTGLRKPPRNLPRLVKTVIPFVMTIYVLVVTSYFTVMSKQEMISSEAIGVTWAHGVFTKGASSIIPIGVGLTALGSLNATFLSSGRLAGVAVKDSQMPEVASWVHVRSKTPILIVYLRMVIAIIMISVADSGQLVRFFIFSVWLFHGTAMLALIVLRVKNKDKVRPYKVNLVLPVVVVLIIAFLLIGPFLRSPNPEFISSLVLVGLSLLCYLPMHWFYSRATLPDKLIIWLQLLFRIAPKNDLRRMSIMRRLSTAVARNSILVPGGASPVSLRRLSDAMLTSLSRMPSLEKSSPVVKKRFSPSPSIIRQINKNRSLVEADVRRGRSNSLFPWVGTGHSESSAPVYRPNARASSSFGSGDGHARPLPRVESMPTPASMYTGNSSANDTTHSDTKVANLSKLNGSVPTIKTYSLPPGVTKGQRVTYNNDVSRNLPNGGAVNSTHTTTATAVSSNMASSRNGSLVSFSNTSSCTQATIPEELSAGDTSLAVNKGDLSCHQSDKSLTLPDEYESDDGRQYELLALPIFPPEEGSSDSSDSDSSSDLDSSRDDLGGIESLFGLTSTGSSRGSSDGSSSDDEEDSFHEQQRLQDELRSELHEIILSNIANDSARSNSLTSV